MKTGKFLILTALVIMLGVASYLLYDNLAMLNASTQRFVQNVTPADRNQSSFPVGEHQFYPNMRYKSKIIQYNLNPDCSEIKKDRMLAAFNILEEETELLKFFQTSNPGDIQITCEEKEEEFEAEYFVAGEGGPTAIIDTGEYYIIENGTVLLLYEHSSCGSYNVELHELLHALGFKHSDNNESIMYNITICNQVLTDDIIEELVRLYSIPELPDLYFHDVEAEKHHQIYLDTKIDVRNQGLKKAKDIIVEIHSDSKKIDSFELEDIDYGEGRYLEVKNIEVPKDTEQLEFIIFAGDEIDEDNNIIELVLG